MIIKEKTRGLITLVAIVVIFGTLRYLQITNSQGVIADPIVRFIQAANARVPDLSSIKGRIVHLAERR